MPSKPYTSPALKTLLTPVYHTNNNKYIFKSHLARDISGTIHTWTCIQKHTLDYFCYNFKQCIQEQETDMHT